MTAFTAVTSVVALAALRDVAELAAVAADPVGGAGSFRPGTPLRAVGDPTNTPVAYGCLRYPLRPSQRGPFAAGLGGRARVYRPGAVVDLSRSWWMFDATDDGWTPSQVLSALGMDFLEPLETL